MPARSRPTTFCSKTVSSDCGAPLDAATKVPQKRYSRRSGDERSPSAVRLAGFHVGPIAALPVPVEPDERFFDVAFGQFLGHRLVIDFADVLDAATRVAGADGVALAAAACAAAGGTVAEQCGRDDQRDFGHDLPGDHFHCWILLIFRPLVEPTDWMSRFQVPAGSAGATVARSWAPVVTGGLSPAITRAPVRQTWGYEARRHFRRY